MCTFPTDDAFDVIEIPLPGNMRGKNPEKQHTYIQVMQIEVS